MKARIVRVGNSRGVRLPKPLLELAGLPEEVEIHAEPGRIIIESARRSRDGWAEAARSIAEVGDDALLDEPTPAFDADNGRGSRQ
jgi:antitoxin MazE